MAFDWLFGAPVRRSYVIELDTLGELVAAIKAHGSYLVPTFVVYEPSSGTYRTVELDGIRSLSAIERKRLRLQARVPSDFNPTPDGQLVIAVDVPLESPADPFITVQPEHSPSSGPLAVKLRKIIEQSDGRVRPLRFRTRLDGLWRSLPGAVVLGTWIWLQLTSPLPLAAYFFGWSFVVIVVVFTIQHLRRRANVWRMNQNRLYPGHRIRLISRQEVSATRAESHRDLRVGIVTFLATALAAVIAGVILYKLGFTVHTP